MRVTSALLLLAVAMPALADVPKPNVIFIMADDLGGGELGCYGQQKIQTPQLDRLAHEGMRFTRFYAGSTVCAPSRSVLMTGRHLGHTTVRGNVGGLAQSLAVSDVTVARVLQQAGYFTGVIGKWGLGLQDEPGAPWRQGFDYNFGYLNQTHAHNYYPSYLWRGDQRVPLPNVVKQTGRVADTGYATKAVAYASDLFATDALKFIEQNRARPFFLYLALTAPHANDERAKALGDGHEVPDLGPYADKPWKLTYKEHAAMVTRMDADIGRLMAKLKTLGLDERTLVIFTSDNGPHHEGGEGYDPEFFDANGPWRGEKRDLYEGGLRVPFIARWPGRIAPGSESAQVGYFGDMMATFAELAGTPPPAHLDSISLVPTLLGRGDQKQHEFLYWEFYEIGPEQAVLLRARWKGIRAQVPDGPIALYDLERDPGETTDVSAEHAEIVTRVSEIMRTAHEDNAHWRFESSSSAAAK